MFLISVLILCLAMEWAYQDSRKTRKIRQAITKAKDQTQEFLHEATGNPQEHKILEAIYNDLTREILSGRSLEKSLSMILAILAMIDDIETHRQALWKLFYFRITTLLAMSMLVVLGFQGFNAPNLDQKNMSFLVGLNLCGIFMALTRYLPRGPNWIPGTPFALWLEQAISPNEAKDRSDLFGIRALTIKELSLGLPLEGQKIDSLRRWGEENARQINQRLTRVESLLPFLEFMVGIASTSMLLIDPLLSHLIERG